MYEVINQGSQNSLILLAEHAGATIPAELDNLGLAPDTFQQDPQMFFDPGSREMAVALAEKLEATAFLVVNSRLVADLNREDYHENVIPTRFHGRDVPGNQGLSNVERQQRLQTYYAPFHMAVRAEIKRRQAAGQTVRLVSIHTFDLEVAFATFPDLVPMPVDIGLLYDEETEMVRRFRSAIKPAPYHFHENYPYDLRKLKTGSILENRKLFGVDVVGIELNANTLKSKSSADALVVMIADGLA